jgi:phosphoribosylanthranilate isomerase
VIRVKVCGITNPADADLAVDAGADALGFIFVERTPRFVTPEVVAPIVRRLPPFVTPVGVFWDHPAGHVKAIAEACGLRALQFHGDEPPEDLAGYELPAIKTIKRPPAGTIDGLPAFQLAALPEMLDAQRYRTVAAAVLLDSAVRWSEGEARPPIEWVWASRLDVSPARVILSGGLDPDNVARAVEIARPYAVDVNSGVEAVPGRKDPDKVRRFVAEARRA